MKYSTELSACKNIIWDWNGTLLNDLDICVVSINRLLQKRRLPQLNIQKYLEIFTFPVKDYYVSAGFDFNQEPYEMVAVEFMDHYLDLVKTAGLHSNVNETLHFFKNSGREQIILSAMEQTELLKLVKTHQIETHFNAVYGIEDHLAFGKIGLAKSTMLKTGFQHSETCLIGDTLHDAEVAHELGIHCLLVANGHQSAQRLQSSGYSVIESLKEIEKVFGQSPISQ